MESTIGPHPRPQQSAAHCAICGATMPALAARCSACGVLSAHGATDLPLPPGTLLANGHYRIEEVLGQGGFGITYRATDAARERTVAIKELFPSGYLRTGIEVQPGALIAAEEFAGIKTKFLDEARVLAQFDHQHIVRVFEAFEANDTAYMVMEYLAGETLASALQKRKVLREGEALALVRQVGDALAELHTAGLLHRDIKPDNIMLCDADEDKRAVLIDFGAAREFTQGVRGHMTTLLTPGYAPLEQYAQHAQHGPYTDIYALGATLYHMLTGDAPVTAVDRASGVALPVPEEVNPYISNDTSDRIIHAMSMKVQHRPQTVADFLNLRSNFTAPYARLAANSPARESAPQETSPHHNSGDPAATSSLKFSWEQVVLDHASPHWPDKCACCFRGTTLTTQIVDGDMTYEVPYCDFCRDHARFTAWRSRYVYRPIGYPFLVGGLYWLNFDTGLSLEITGLLLFVAYVAARVIATAAINKKCGTHDFGPRCSWTSYSVRFNRTPSGRWRFRFRNRQYARDFCRLNAHSIVMD